MNVFAKNGNSAKDEYESNVQLLSKFAEKFPLVAEYLLGLPSAEAEDSVQPASVRFFLNGGRLKVQISPRNSEMSLFATIQDLTDPMEDLEKQLTDGQYEFKRGSERKIPY